MDIKIFVSHRIDKKAKCIDNPLFTNIRCGAYFDKSNSELMGDDTGDNISSKRLSYCELTIHYWAWKNVEADYYGFCHYRRYLSFSNRMYPENAVGVVECPQIDETAVERFRLDETSMRNEIEKYDIITNKSIPVKKSGNFLSVYDYCKKTPYGYVMSDIDVLREIISEKYPEELTDFDDFFNGTENRWYNCYIMKKHIFKKYATWLFDILFEFERRIDVSQHTQEQLRVFGVMAERLWGVYLRKIQREGKYSVCEKQLVYFEDTSDSKEILEPGNEKVVIAVPIEEQTVVIAYSSIHSILETLDSTQKVRIVLLHNDIKKKLHSILQLQQEYENVEIIEFNVSLIIKKYIKIQPNIAYSRDLLYFSVLDVLKKYERAIFVTPHVNMLTNIGELYEVSLGENYAAAPMDALALCNCYSNKEVGKYFVDKLCQTEPYNYFNFNICVLKISEITKRYTATSFIKMMNIKHYVSPFYDIMNVKLFGNIMRLPTEWGVIADSNDFLHEQTRWYLPYGLYNDYIESYKKPKAISFSGLAFPWYNTCTDFSDVFWNSLRRTELYEQGLEMLVTQKSIEIAHYVVASKDVKLPDNRTGARKVADFFFPKGTKRRELLKKILPKGSKRWAVLKQIYYVFSPKHRRSMREDIK